MIRWLIIFFAVSRGLLSRQVDTSMRRFRITFPSANFATLDYRSEFRRVMCQDLVKTMNLSERKVFKFMTCLRTNVECSERKLECFFVSFKLEGLTETTIKRLCHGSSTNNKDTHSKEIIAQTIASMWKKSSRWWTKSSRWWTNTNSPCCSDDLLVKLKMIPSAYLQLPRYAKIPSFSRPRNDPTWNFCTVVIFLLIGIWNNSSRRIDIVMMALEVFSGH